MIAELAFRYSRPIGQEIPNSGTTFPLLVARSYARRRKIRDSGTRLPLSAPDRAGEPPVAEQHFRYWLRAAAPGGGRVVIAELAFRYSRPIGRESPNSGRAFPLLVARSYTRRRNCRDSGTHLPLSAPDRAGKPPVAEQHFRYWLRNYARRRNCRDSGTRLPQSAPDRAGKPQ